MGKLYTFYSYKGGVGRSMALANVAALLSKRKRRVLIIDWDLEAPGLEKYFRQEPSVVRGSREQTAGVVDIVNAFAEGQPLDWKKCLLHAIPFGPDSPSVDILSAGQDTPDYVPKLQEIDWRRLFNEQNFGAYLEEMRDEWLTNYDFVLVDSRTGITDIGGVCTIHLPDVLVLFFTANEQSLAGVLDVMNRAQTKYGDLPEEYERPHKLLGVPVPSRFEYFTEYESATHWLKKFSERLADIYADWLPRDTSPKVVLEKLFVPNIPFWSFGENLPVVQEGVTNPRSIGAAYELLARLIEEDLDWNKAVRGETADTGERAPEIVNQEVERIYSDLSAPHREDARRVFTNLVLVAPEGKGQDARRRVPLSEFAAQRVVAALAEAKLLTVARDEALGEEVVEIAQDATLRHWDRLKVWLDKDREFLLWRQQLRSSMASWEKGERQLAYLLNGSALKTAEEFLDARPDELSSSEKVYVESSRHEESRLRRAGRLSRAAGLTALIVFAALSAFYINRLYRQQSEAERRAQQQENFNRSVQATARGIDLFENEDIPGAVAAYNEALALKSDYAAAYYNRGEALLNLSYSNSDRAESEKQREQAISDFNMAASLTTDEETRRLSKLYIQQAKDPIDPITDSTLTPTPTPHPSPTPTPRPNATPSASPVPTPDASPTPLITVNITPRVYIQYDQTLPGKSLGSLSKLLSSVGYKVLPPDGVSSERVPRSTEVRYYRKSDAREAAQIVSLLGSWGVAKARAKYLVGFENSTSVRPKHFEIWLSADAFGADDSPQPMKK